jgi:hypothetical protein
LHELSSIPADAIASPRARLWVVISHVWRSFNPIPSLLVATALTLVACGGPPEDFGDWESRFAWGAHVALQSPSEPYADAVQRAETQLGAPMNAARVYHRWEDPFPTDTEKFLKSSKRLIVLSIKPIRADGSRIPWVDIANAQDGDTLHDELTTWLKNIKKLGRPIYVTLHHEPETADDQASGTTADYLAAWRRFATQVREHGGPHARLMWIMTDRAFTLPADNRQTATAWYPGDDFVDAIGVDAFNWFTCRDRSEGWKTAAELVEPARQFALTHPDKELWITELGTIDDPKRPNRRTKWLAEAALLPRSPGWEQLHGVLYFDDVHGSEFPKCNWHIDDTSGVALGGLARVPTGPATTVAGP